MTTPVCMLEKPLSPESQAPVSICARIAATDPHLLAVTGAGEALTYGDLELGSNRLARHLISLGAGPEVAVGIYVERSPAFIVAALAIWKAGAAYLPLDPATPPERIRTILLEAQAPILVSHRWIAAGLPGGTWRVLDLDIEQRQIERYSGLPIDSVAGAQDLAYVIYTSGSTGQPKGVEVTHASLLNLVEWHCRTFNVTAADRASAVAALAFDAAVWEMWPALSRGASVHLAGEAQRRSAEALRDWFVAERISIAFAPTILAEQLIAMDWPAGAPLRTLLTGADTLHRRPTSTLPFQLVNNYGPTECTILVTSGIVDPHGQGTPTLGRAIDNTELLILDPALNPVEEGELFIGGASLARGYRGQPELTRQSFIEHPFLPGQRLYRTGDRVRLLPNAELAFLGRIDEQLKIRGYRVEPGEIVAALSAHPAVAASAVAASKTGDSLTAYIVARGALTLAGLRDHLGARLPDYMIPANFLCIDALPLNASGKLDRNALPEPSAANLLKSETSSPPPANPLEDKIAVIVSALLTNCSVGREDNFFFLGGHSMLAAQLLARLREAFGVRLSLRQLFEAPTVAALSLEIGRVLAAAK